MMRQPPRAVPAHIVNAHRTFIHAAMASGWFASGGAVRKNDSQAGSWSNAPLLVPVSNTSAMMPMVFCASFMPWLMPIKPELPS